MTPFGGIQGQDWRYSFGQIRLRRDRLSANVFYNWSDAGDSYVLRTGDPLVDDSRVLVGQLQHGATAGPVDLLYGADLRWTDPRTGGTISGANEDSDRTTEIGGYAHATWAVSPRLQAIGALRVDHHTALNDLALSPRVALVFKPAPTQALRASYNRAFTSPDANDLFLDIVAGEIALPGGFGYAIRGTGVPKDGFHFRRDCGGGLCMRSPFAIAIGGLPGQYLPADATVLWPAVVAYAQSQGIDLSGHSRAGRVPGRHAHRPARHRCRHPRVRGRRSRGRDRRRGRGAHHHECDRVGIQGVLREPGSADHGPVDGARVGRGGVAVRRDSLGVL